MFEFDEQDIVDDTIDNVNKDKIFENSFYESGYTGSSVSSYYIDDIYRTPAQDIVHDEGEVFDFIMNAFNIDENFNKYIKPNEDGEYIKVNKKEINEIYNFFRLKFDNIYVIEVFSVLLNILDVTPSKFYESLSLSHKEDLIEQLRERGYLKTKYKLF